jgi:hypothetical protein
MRVGVVSGRRVSPPAAAGLSILVLVSLLAVAPRPADAAGRRESRDVARFATALTRMCRDLSSARDQLTGGKVDEASFADRVLELFVQADSVRAVLGTSTWIREPGPGTALERGFHFLIVSLRENYFGITERDGTRFVSADRALRAAVAWRSDVASASDLALP